MKKLFLIDAYAMIYRAYYAFINNPRITASGLNTSAALGFTNSLAEIIKKENPTHIAVVFDPPCPTFRHLISPQYKAQRPPTPEGISADIPYIKRILDGFKIKYFFVDGFEADDTIGTLAVKAEKLGFKVFMVTSDKDYNQLVTDNIVVYKPGKSGSDVEIIDAQAVKSKFGIDDVKQFIDFLALWGDTSDNVKGVTSVGEKTALKLISQYKSIENIYADINNLKGKQKENFINDKETVFLAKKLVTIVTDVPVDFIESDLEYRLPDEQILRKVFDELEFKNLVERVLPKKQQDVEPIGLFAKQDSTQPSLFDTPQYQTVKTTPHNYYCVDTYQKLFDLVTKLNNYNEICFDTETTSLTVHVQDIVGMSFAVEEFEAYYIPFNPDNKDEIAHKLDILRPVFANKNTLKIGQNLKFDIQVLKKYDVDVEGPLFDTMVAHYLLQSEQRHNMDYLAQVYLNYQPVSIENLIGNKSTHQLNMKDVDLNIITEYAAEDADVTLRLKHVLYKELQKENLLQFAIDIEMPLVRVLASMEFTGVSIDTELLRNYNAQLNIRTAEIEKNIYQIAGSEFNLASPKQLGTVLFEKLKISSTVKKTKTGQYATGEEELKKFSDIPIVNLILQWRTYNKLSSTYAQALPELINPVTGKIHTSFNQTVTSTGRLSSTNPNLQNIPVRTSDGKIIRSAFVASSSDRLIYSADYSQIELRVMAHMSGDNNLIEAFNLDKDIHSSTAAYINHIDISQVTKEMRSRAKSANFGIIYGISSFGLSNDTGLNRSEAKQFIDEYFKTYPGIKTFIDKAINDCRQTGYVSTLSGRKRYMPDINSRNSIMRQRAERNAVNTPVQGTAADIIKIAMNDIYRKFIDNGLKSNMIIQVHDELVFDVAADEKESVRQIVENSMESAFQLKVKLKSEGNFASDWSLAH